MDELLVLIIKLIIRGLSSTSERAPKPMLGAAKPIAPPPPIGKVVSAPGRRGGVPAKGKPGPARSAAAQPVVAAASPRASAESARTISATRSASAQIAETFRSQKNLAAAMVMTELLMKPVALRRAGSN